MVDLHSHTDCSDGALSPCRLVDLAKELGLRALAITDHDTVEGYDAAAEHAASIGLELICGIELNAKFRGSTVHLLGYFFDGPPGETFRERLGRMAASRRDRNIRLVERLRELGVQVTIEEAEARGRCQTGRPHFAQLLLEKGYVSNYREAFDRYLDESAPGFVDRQEPSLEELIGWIHDSGGVASWAHPGRFVKESADGAETLFAEMAEAGVDAIECYHRDHDYQLAEQFRAAAEKLGLGVTGGSDFHGPSASTMMLGGLQLPDALLDNLKKISRGVAR